MLSDRAAAAIGHVGIYREGSDYRVAGSTSIRIGGGRPAAVVNFVVEEILFQFVKARREFLWLHAAAVERGGRAVVLPGESGRGKSTVSTFLCERGWHFMSDDVLALRIENDEVIPFLLTPGRRVHTGRELLTDGFSSLVKESVDIGPDGLRRAPAVIGAIVFPGFSPTRAPMLARLSQGDAALELLRHTRNIPDHGAAAADRVVRLVRNVQSFSLNFGFDGEGIELVDSDL
jgi:hypothetical protein